MLCFPNYGGHCILWERILVGGGPCSPSDVLNRKLDVPNRHQPSLIYNCVNIEAQFGS